MATAILHHEGSSVRRAQIPSDPVTAAGQRIAWAYGRIEQAEADDRPAEVRRLERTINVAEQVIAETTSSSLAGALVHVMYASAEVERLAAHAFGDKARPIEAAIKEALASAITVMARTAGIKAAAVGGDYFLAAGGAGELGE